MSLRRVAVTVFVLALVIRVAFVVLQTKYAFLETSDFVTPDSAIYLAMAQSIAAGQGFAWQGHATAHYGPLYPVMLTPFVGVSSGPLAIGIFQCVLGAMTAVLIGLITLRLSEAVGWSRRRGVLAFAISGSGAAIYPHLILYTGYVLTETLFVFLAMLSVYLVIEATTRNSIWLAICAGLVGSAATQTRVPWLAPVGLLFVWWLFAGARYHLLHSRPAIAFVVALAIPLLAWGFRNQAELGGFLLSTEGGEAFYMGNSWDSNGGRNGYLIDDVDFPQLRFPPGTSELEANNVYMRTVISDIQRDPVRAVARVPTKVINMWRPTLGNASLRNAIVFAAAYLPVLILGLLGAFVLARRGIWGIGAIPAIILVSWFLVHVVAFGVIRYRLPAEAILLVTLPFGTLALVRRLGIANS